MSHVSRAAQGGPVGHRARATGGKVQSATFLFFSHTPHARKEHYFTKHHGLVLEPLDPGAARAASAGSSQASRNAVAILPDCAKAVVQIRIGVLERLGLLRRYGEVAIRIDR